MSVTGCIRIDRSTHFGRRFVGMMLAAACVLGALSIAPAQVGAQDTKPQVAVLEFAPSGMVTKAEASAFADQLRSDLVNLHAYTVIDRGQVDAVLKELAFQQEAITDAGQAAEVGRLLGVQYIITGRIISLRGSFQVTVQMTDVESGQIVRSEVARRDGDMMGLLEEDLGRIAAKLSGVAASSVSKPTKRVAETSGAETHDSTFTISVLDLAIDGSPSLDFGTRFGENGLLGVGYYGYYDASTSITLIYPYIGYATQEQVSPMAKVGLALVSVTLDQGTPYVSSGSGVGLGFIFGIRARLGRPVFDMGARTLIVEGISATDPYIAVGVSF